MAEEAPVVAPVVETPATSAPVAPVVEVDIPADGGFPAEPELPLEPPPVVAGAVPEPEHKPVKKTAFQTRIDALTAQRETERLGREEALRQVELYKAMAEGRTAPEGEQPPVAPQPQGLIPGSPEFQRAVTAEAGRLAAAEAAKGRTDKLLKAGEGEYKDFTERCNVVASLGAGDRPDFMQIVTDTDIIPDGHKLIAYLADHPEEAAKAVDPSVNTAKMTAMLVRMAEEAGKTKPVVKPISAAPAPIKTIDGTSKGSDEPRDSDDMATYAAKYKAKQAERLKTNQPARFARH